ncbi:uncharacterized protein LOC144147363 isoform X1 [Haemaphysalis longicornis]
MVSCCVRKCNSSSSGSRKSQPDNANPEKVGFFAVPVILSNNCDKTKEYSRNRRQLWLKRINKLGHMNLSTKYIKVCGRHFITGRPANLFDVTNPDWAPSLHLGYDSPEHNLRVCSSMERYERAKQRARRKKEAAAAKAQVSPGEPAEGSPSPAKPAPTIVTVEIWKEEGPVDEEPAVGLPIITDVRSIAGELDGESIFTEEQATIKEESTEPGWPVPCTAAASGRPAERPVREQQVQTRYTMGYLDKLESDNRELRQEVYALRDKLALPLAHDSTCKLVGQLEADNKELRKEVFFLQEKLVEALPAKDAYKLLRQGGSTAILRRLVGRRPIAPKSCSHCGT